MEGSQFDALSRHLGSSRSRRGALKAIAGAIVASVVGVSAADAQTPCVAKNKSCQSDGQCCDGMVCEWGMCKPGCRIDGEFAHPKKSPAGNTCVVCQPEISTTVGVPTKEGKRCYSGDPYAGATTCQNGVCASDEPISCPPLTACHLEGTVNPANGLCEYPPAPEGTLCGAAEMCHGGFYSPAAACDGNGHCIGGGTKTVNCAPYQCVGSACGSSCASNTDCTNGAACCDGQCVALNTPDHCGGCGQACDVVDSCTPPTCEDGVCRTISACEAGTICEDGTCVEESICLELLTTCDSDDQCCGDAACGPIGNLGVRQCCVELGAHGCTGNDCCSIVFAPGIGEPVSCIDGVCGGPGAWCTFGGACASGVCCGLDLVDRHCCAEGETCERGACVSIAL